MNGPEGWIISFPKSGRTWLRILLGKVLCEESGTDDADILDTEVLTSALCGGPLFFTHAGSDIKHGHRFDELKHSMTRYEDASVLFLVRDPRDVLVSCYFQATKRLRVYEGSLTSFLRDDRYGARKVAAFYRIWAQNKDVPQRFLSIRYEDMRQDTERMLRSVLAFLAITSVSDESIQHAIAFGEFGNMQKLESEGYFANHVLRPGNVKDPESFKVRRGIVGGYRDYFSDTDRAYVDEILSGEGGEFCAPYLTS